MKKIITINYFSLCFAVFFFVLGQTACQKDTTNCTAVVIVKDVNNNLISGAYIKLYAPHGQVGANGTTNASGSASFTFTLPAIFNVAASKGLALNDTLKGTNIIQLQIGQTVSTTVTVK